MCTRAGSFPPRGGGGALTPKEMFEQLTPENKEAIIRLIETLAASQSSDPPAPDSPR